MVYLDDDVPKVDISEGSYHLAPLANRPLANTRTSQGFLFDWLFSTLFKLGFAE